MKEIVIIGAGDLGKELVWLIEDINKRTPTYVILGFLDDAPEKQNETIAGYPVIGTMKYLKILQLEEDVCAVIALQNGLLREAIVQGAKPFDRWETVIHPNAVISGTVQLGSGCVVFANVTISVDTKIGMHGLFYMSASIGNDCIVQDYVSVMSHASISEHTQIGACSYFAANSSIIPGKRTEKNVQVSVGAVVTKDAKEHSKVSGGFSGIDFFK